MRDRLLRPTSVALALLFVAAGCVAVWYWTAIADEWMPHAATAAVAIAATVTIVERIVRGERKRELLPFLRLPIRRLRKALSRQLELVAAMCYAAAESNSGAANFGFLNVWSSEVKFLDFETQIEGVAWRDFVVKESRYVGEMLRDAEDSLLAFSDIAEALQESVIERIECFLDNTVFLFFSSDWIGSVRASAIAGGTAATTPYLALGMDSEEADDLRHSFTEATRGLIDAYRALVQHSPAGSEERAALNEWLDAYAAFRPGWVRDGAARYRGPIQDALVPIFRRKAAGRYSVGR